MMSQKSWYQAGVSNYMLSVVGLWATTIETVHILYK